jgi:hypothetical protein
MSGVPPRIPITDPQELAQKLTILLEWMDRVKDQLNVFLANDTPS